MPHADFDIAILGAGPVGSALALLLAQHAPQPERIALIAKPSTSVDRTDDAPDPRALALNHGSIQLLKQIHAHSGVAAPIRTVHVSQKGRLGRTLIQASELDVDMLGAVVTYPNVVEALNSALEHSKVTRLIAQHHGRDALPNQVHTTQGTIQCGIKVLSDGVRPTGIERHYDQHGLVSIIRSRRPQSGWAYERFTQDGPFALLPHPAAPDLYALVWCNSPQKTATLKALPDNEFEAQLLQTFGTRLGKLELASERFVFPLSMYAGPSLPARHTVAIGNAAQTLHPVAGQGLNLGLRDAAQLSHALRPWLLTPDADPSTVLEPYAGKRRLDRWLTTSVTDFLPRAFAVDNSLIHHAGGLALLAMDVFEAARVPLVRHLLQGTRT